MLARITGLVLGTEDRSGKSRTTDNPYHLTDVRVLVASSDVAVFTVNNLRSTANGPAPRFAKGDMCDVLVNVDVYGARLSCSYQSPWDDDATLDLSQLVTVDA